MLRSEQATMLLVLGAQGATEVVAMAGGGWLLVTPLHELNPVIYAQALVVVSPVATCRGVGRAR